MVDVLVFQLGLLNIGGVGAAGAVLVCIPADFGAGGSLRVMLHQIVRVGVGVAVVAIAIRAVGRSGAGGGGGLWIPRQPYACSQHR